MAAVQQGGHADGHHQQTGAPFGIKPRKADEVTGDPGPDGVQERQRREANEV